MCLFYFILSLILLIINQNRGILGHFLHEFLLWLKHELQTSSNHDFSNLLFTMLLLSITVSRPTCSIKGSTQFACTSIGWIRRPCLMKKERKTFCYDTKNDVDENFTRAFEGAPSFSSWKFYFFLFQLQKEDAPSKAFVKFS